MFFQLAFVAIAAFIVWCFLSDRTDDLLVKAFLTLVTWVGGTFNVYFINDGHKDSRAILNQKRKGRALEYLMATPAWFPLINVESIDGPVWERMRKHSTENLAATNFTERLPDICRQEVASLRKSGVDKVDCQVLNALCVRIMWSLCFGKEVSEEICQDMVTLIDLLRGEIAQKTPTSPEGSELKTKLVHTVLEAAKTTPWLAPLLESAEHEREFVNSIIQPFFMSPCINIADVFAPLVKVIEKAPCNRILLEDKNTIQHLIFETLFHYHPFPIFERDLSKAIGDFAKGSHVYVLNMKNDHKGEFCPAHWGKPEFARNNMWRLYGSGPRACVGSKMASLWMTEMLYELTQTYELSAIVPWEGKLWSGRDNDKDENPLETLKRLGLAIILQIEKSIGMRKSWFHETHLQKLPVRSWSWM